MRTKLSGVHFPAFGQCHILILAKLPSRIYFSLFLVSFATVLQEVTQRKGERCVISQITVAKELTFSL